MEEHSSKQRNKRNQKRKHDQNRSPQNEKRQFGTQKRIRHFLIGALAIILTGGGVYELFPLFAESFLTPQMELLEFTEASGEMRVTFLDVAQGDCTIVQTEEQNMVIDAGNNHQGETVADWLEAQGITRLDYLILTHPDADHIGGADNILRTVDVERVIMPDVANDTVTYEEVMDLIEAQEIPVDFPEVGDRYLLGDAGFTVLCPRPEEVSEEDLNGSSVGIKLVHGVNSFVMCGDAEAGSEQNMVHTFGDALESDVLKCGHHGSSTSNSASFLQKVNPTWAVISCGRDNSYGHPHVEVLAELQDADIQVYRTDELGTVTAYSDGQEIFWELP